MATIRNITDDTLALFRADAPPAYPGGEIDVRDENFVGRAWPAATWELVTPPAGEYVDASTDQAHLWITAEQVGEVEAAATPEPIEPEAVEPEPIPEPTPETPDVADDDAEHDTIESE